MFCIKLIQKITLYAALRSLLTSERSLKGDKLGGYWSHFTYLIEFLVSIPVVGLMRGSAHIAWPSKDLCYKVQNPFGRDSKLKLKNFLKGKNKGAHKNSSSGKLNWSLTTTYRKKEIIKLPINVYDENIRDMITWSLGLSCFILCTRITDIQVGEEVAGLSPFPRKKQEEYV